MRVAVLALGAAILGAADSWTDLEAIRVDPGEAVIDAPMRLAVTGVRKDGLQVDASETASWSVENEKVARLDGGRVIPVGDGTTEVLAAVGGLRARARITVQGSRTGADFELDVLPVLTRHGCNSGGCHGSAKGQGGFKLSLLGYDADADHEALAVEHRSRRIHRARPEESLLVAKPTLRVKHGGGRRFGEDSEAARLLVNWIRAGAPRRVREERLESVVVFPAAAVLPLDATLPLLVAARYSNGVTRDVTAEALFSSNDDSIAAVTPGGLVRARAPGETAIVARFGGHVVPAQIGSPLGGESPEFATANLVDEHLARKWKSLRIRPAPPASDAVLLRRAFLDVIGTLPTPDEARAFLADRSEDKRASLVDALIRRPEFDAFWTLKLSERLVVGAEKFPEEYAAWIRAQVARDAPMTEVARSIVTAAGREPAGGFFLASGDPRLMMELTLQSFHGFRMQCANCHNHPLERFSQDEYHSLAAFYAKVRAGRGGVETGGVTELTHPRTGKPVSPGAPGLTRAIEGDRRVAFAEWLVADRRFPRAMANLLWAEVFGRGLVEPVDDLRASNPASVPELLEALAAEFSKNPRVRPFVRLLATSRAYGLDSKGGGPERFFARAIVKPLGAEVLLDAVAQATGVPNSFGRAIEQHQPNAVQHFSLEAFGRCRRESLCTVRGEFSGSLKQALHLISDDVVSGRVAQSRFSDKPVEELTWRALGRPPTEKERAHWAPRVATREEAEDLFWALLVSREFQFRH